MKAFFKFLVVISIFLTSVFVSGCNNSYEYMIQDFNKENCIPESKRIHELSITDADFDADSMLLPRYFFKDGYEVTLTAPLGGKKYNWELVNNVKGKKILQENEEKITVCTKQSFSFMPGEDFEIGTENKLVLTVTGNTGTEYIDTTIVIITSW